MIERFQEGVDAHLGAVRALREQGATVAAMAEATIEALRAGGKVLLAGNGGSAADCQHVAGEFVGRFLYDRRPLPAIALSTDTSVLTAVGNDYRYEAVFARQVEALAKEGDIFWGFSTSGKSPNVVAAARAAKRLGCTVLAFTGRSPGPLGQAADLVLAAAADGSPRVQEVHALAYHLICELVEAALCPRRPAGKR